jgi:hypothetical protein
MTDLSRLGCGKFGRRFGGAEKSIKSSDGRALNCRSVNTRVITRAAVPCKRAGETQARDHGRRA